MPWLSELLQEVQTEVNRLTTQQLDNRPALAGEKEGLQANMNGWAMSLANPQLDGSLRTTVEAEWAGALARQRRIDALLAEQDSTVLATDQVVNPQQVLDRLHHLAEVLAVNNPTCGNLELALHIDTIKVFPDKTVEVRTIKLGALPSTTASW